MRGLWVWLLVLCGALPASAQRAPAADSLCTYDACALRIEPAFLGGLRIVRGAEGERVGRLGLFGSDLSEAVASSERAREYALEYERSRTAATLVTLGGVALYALAVIGAESGPPSDSNALWIGALAGGVGLTFYGTHLNLGSERARSRAVWWYNRDLPR